MNDNRRIITNIRAAEGGPWPSAPAGLLPMEITFQDGSTTIRDLAPVPGANFRYRGSFSDETFILGVGIEADNHDHETVRRAVAAKSNRERPLGLL